MNYKYYLLLFLITQQSIAFANDADPNLGIIPAPVIITKSPGTVAFTNRTVIKAEDPADKSVRFFTDYLRNTLAFKNNILTNNSKTATGVATIEFTGQGAENLHQKGYKLTISPGRVKIVAKRTLFFVLESVKDGNVVFKEREVRFIINPD